MVFDVLSTARPREGGGGGGSTVRISGTSGDGSGAFFVPMGLRARRADEQEVRQEVVCQPHPKKYLKNA